MGNTPTQQPFEGDSPGADESGAGASVRETVVGFVRATLDSVRRRVSVFPSLNLASAFVVDDDDAAVVESRRLRPADPDEGDDADDTHAALPARSLPLVQPARDTSRENGPDLEATEEDGQLSIYYPERANARITSDTWEDVER
ncbi:hypothetical protein SAMN05216388_10494 [Halorientalis persicus]|jgi:hypothetical protein|uniref:Uncharacterized protein n=1 Tax=Halorientalis persicus TaxID=1367881 RepID=A0A1H8W5F0_9EURY|nr:hypothetical protein [Halorientalis persicus]SEP22872.1 hypothetical protein SAMN05216388_10494 [Halorientalis persicus]